MAVLEIRVGNRRVILFRFGPLRILIVRILGISYDEQLTIHPAVTNHFVM